MRVEKNIVLTSLWKMYEYGWMWRFDQLHRTVMFSSVVQTDGTNEPSIIQEESQMCLQFQGNVQALAYVHNKATVGETLAVCASV